MHTDCQHPFSLTTNFSDNDKQKKKKSNDKGLTFIQFYYEI